MTGAPLVVALSENLNRTILTFGNVAYNCTFVAYFSTQTWIFKGYDKVFWSLKIVNTQ